MLLVVACISALSAYGVKATIPPAEGTRLSPEDVEHLREIVRRLAAERHLMELDPSSESNPRGGIRDSYITARRPSLGIGLWIPPDRQVAEIHLYDWDSTGEPSLRTREIEQRLREELTAAFPNRPIRFEDEDIGNWRP
jgi:hypothetical protein